MTAILSSIHGPKALKLKLRENNRLNLAWSQMAGTRAHQTDMLKRGRAADIFKSLQIARLKVYKMKWRELQLNIGNPQLESKK